MSESNIKWTEQTWNPVTGCTKISAGCKNCYAETMAHRLKAMDTKGYENGFKVTVSKDLGKLYKPHRRKKPTTYFVCSMSDLFHEEAVTGTNPLADNPFMDWMFGNMVILKRHRFLLLTKRPNLMVDWATMVRNTREYENNKPAYGGDHNVWYGVTVENIKEGLPRIEILRKLKYNTFLSIEPLLEDLGELDLSDIDWVIVGGESGHNARPMRPDWVRSIRDQCIKHNVPFFFNQWGTYGEDGIKRSKKANGHLLDGQKWRQLPW